MFYADKALRRLRAMRAASSWERALDSPPSGQIEHEQESVVDGTQLVVGEVVDPLAQCASVDCSDHLAEHLGRLLEQCDLGVEARWKRRARGRADDNCREGQEIVGLQDHRVATALLSMTASAGQRDLVDITTDHAAPP
jgi:hypothetical protein